MYISCIFCYVFDILIVFIIMHISGTLNGSSCNASNFPHQVFVILILMSVDKRVTRHADGITGWVGRSVESVRFIIREHERLYQRCHDISAPQSVAQRTTRWLTFYPQLAPLKTQSWDESRVPVFHFSCLLLKMSSMIVNKWMMDTDIWKWPSGFH